MFPFRDIKAHGFMKGKNMKTTVVVNEKKVKTIVAEFENMLDQYCEELPDDKFLKLLKKLEKLVNECCEGHGLKG